MSANWGWRYQSDHTRQTIALVVDKITPAFEFVSSTLPVAGNMR